MYCSKCGTQLNGAAFCSNCGNPSEVGGSQPSQAPNPTIPAVEVEPAKPMSGLAIAGFIVSFFGYFGVVGLILSWVALLEINRSKGTKGGQGFAIAGIVIGGLWLVSGLIGIFTALTFLGQSVTSYY